MPDFDVLPDCQHIEGYLKRYAASVVIPPHQLRLMGPDRTMQEIVYHLVRAVQVVPCEEKISVPADWWQHFKERWFRGWALPRWPVQCTVYTAEALYPDSLRAVPPHMGTPLFTLARLPDSAELFKRDIERGG